MLLVDRHDAVLGNDSLFSALLTTIPTAVALLDQQLHYLCVSQQWMETYGTPNLSEEVSFVSQFSNSTPLIQATQHALEGHAIEIEECRTIDGVEEWIRWKLRPWREGLGAIAGVILVSKNVTARKQAEAELRQSHALLQRRVRSRTQRLSQVIVRLKQEVSDRQQAELALEQVNHTLEHRVGVRTLALQDTIAQLQTEIQERQRLEAELRQRTEVLTTTLKQLQQTQTQLIQQEKMSSLGQLVAGIAHEINNPINFIYGNLQPAQDYVTDLLRMIELYQTMSALAVSGSTGLPQTMTEALESIDLEFIREDLQKLLKSMRVGAERIREIVKSLRLFSRLDEAEEKIVNLHDGIESTLMLLEHRLKKNKHRPAIQVHKSYALLPLVQCYAGQLNQVLINLLNNAIDALEESNQNRSFAEIETHPNQIWIDTEKLEPNQVRITIRDNGMGIAEDKRLRIFDPFFTTKSVGKGTGLGLSISYQIITEKHHGKLFCDSLVGQGTKFVIEIPVRQSSTMWKT